MARVLAIGVFIVLQGFGAFIALQCQGAVADWMTGGHWVSPAVRVPLVAIGAMFAELGLLAAFCPCNRLVASLFGCRPYALGETPDAGMAASIR